MKNFDPNAMMGQARKMKDEMERVQRSLAERMVEGSSGGGVVTVVADGNQGIHAVRIKPEAIDPDDPSFLEDLVLVAIKEALSKSKVLSEAEMSKVTGGMNLPGMF